MSDWRLVRECEVHLTSRGGREGEPGGDRDPLGTTPGPGRGGVGGVSPGSPAQRDSAVLRATAAVPPPGLESLGNGTCLWCSAPRVPKDKGKQNESAGGRPGQRQGCSGSKLCRDHPGPAPAPPPAPGSARPAAVPESSRRSRHRGGVPGPSQGAELGSPRLCFRPPRPARRVGPLAGLAEQPALRLRAEALRPPQGPAHQTLPGGRLPVWPLLLVTPGRRLPWKGMVLTRWWVGERGSLSRQDGGGRGPWVSVPSAVSREGATPAEAPGLLCGGPASSSPSPPRAGFCNRCAPFLPLGGSESGSPGPGRGHHLSGAVIAPWAPRGARAGLCNGVQGCRINSL